MSSSSSSSAIFSGSSRYSSDFQSVIDRAVSIASLPMTQLQNEKSDLSSQSSALNGINSRFTSLSSAVQTLESALGKSSYQASVSDSNVISATTSDGVAEGTYSLEVQDIGAYASSMTTSAWSADSGTHTYSVQVGSTTITLDPSDNKASSIAAEINAKGGGVVKATVVNVGGSSGSDYRIVLQSAKLGDLTPKLLVDGSDVQTEQSAGRVAKYVVAGSGNVVESDTRTVSIADGLDVTMLESNAGSQVSVTVSRSTSALQSALSNFVSAYNSATSTLDAQRGNNGGALAGQSIVFDLSRTLRNLATWTDAGGSNGLSSLGLDIDSNGTMTFDSSVLAESTADSFTKVADLLGSSTGSGFLKFATDSLNAVDGTDGELAAAIDSVKNQSTTADTAISNQQDLVDALKTRLNEQMATADATIATMEQQYTYLYNMFSEMNANAQSYK